LRPPVTRPRAGSSKTRPLDHKGVGGDHLVYSAKFPEAARKATEEESARKAAEEEAARKAAEEEAARKAAEEEAARKAAEEEAARALRWVFNTGLERVPGMRKFA